MEKFSIFTQVIQLVIGRSKVKLQEFWQKGKENFPVTQKSSNEAINQKRDRPWFRKPEAAWKLQILSRVPLVLRLPSTNEGKFLFPFSNNLNPVVN